MRPAFFLSAMLLALATGLSAITVSELYVSGVAEGERRYVASILPLAKGDSFPSIAALERRARLAESFLKQGGAYSSVAIEIDEISEDEVELYVILKDASIGALDVFGISATAIPHFPSYATGATFGFDLDRQYLGIDLPLPRRLRLDALAGHAMADGAGPGAAHAISAKLGATYAPLPYLSVYAPVEMDAFPAAGSPASIDLALRAGFKLDLSYLEKAYLFGAKLEGSARKGIADYSQSSARASISLGFRPSASFYASATASAYAESGEPSPLQGLGAAAGSMLRLPPSAAPAGSAVNGLAAFARLDLPWTIDLGIAGLVPAVYAFVEGYAAYEELSWPWTGDMAPSALGGGLMLALSAPISMTFELGYGYSLADKRPAFVFGVK